MLFNNLVAFGLECSVLVADMMKTSFGGQIQYIAGPGPGVMTALDMPGFSISFLQSAPQNDIFLQSPTTCSAMPMFQLVEKSLLSPPR